MASLQQIVEQLVLLATEGTNVTTTGSDGVFTTSSPRGPVELATTTFKMLFSASALRDWAILLVIGSLFETARRMLSSLWRTLINTIFITAAFDDDDVSFQWIMHWLSKHPSWKGVRNVQISTSNFELHAVQLSSDEDSGSDSRKVAYLPAVSESYTLWYKRHWMRVTRSIETERGGWYTRETLVMSIMTRDHGILSEILQEAKKGYIEAQTDKIGIFISDRFNGNSGGGWRELATRPKRPLNSIILDPGITELVVDDVRDFLDSKQWYAERGIPFRRGYLLYGAPGSGKTSLIHSIAGELGLNVYIISLSRSGLDDTGLSELISALPERCIALMEDIDAAFHHGLSRESPRTPSTRTSDHSNKDPSAQPDGPPVATDGRVSLSGLLNALDGIGAQEGRVLFATTNKYSSLDPALCRPGRMDLHIEFKLASRFQAKELFKRFYAPSSSAPVSATEGKNTASSEKHGNGWADGDVGEEPLIDLFELQSQSSQPPSSQSIPSSPTLSAIEKIENESLSNNPKTGPAYVGFVHNHRAPTLSHSQIDALAGRFALAVPERQLSMASLQGFLMMYKTRPFAAVADIGAWAGKELAEREAEKGKEGS